MNQKEIVQKFYDKALTVNTETAPLEVMKECMADDFKSVSLHESASREELAGKLGFFWQLVPDLQWVPQEMIELGNQVVVRSIASGTPKGNFMGVECDGGKRFEMETIDIHTLNDGKITLVHHVEDWMSAIKQLS